MKYAIHRTYVQFYNPDMVISMDQFQDIAYNLEQSHKNKDIDYGYSGTCINCDHLDYLIQGHCKPCFDKKGMEYE